MPKKGTKPKRHAAKVIAVEAENHRELQQLRRLNGQQRRITELSRSLVAAVRRADGARLNAARALCADTGWGVFGIEEWDRAQRAVEELRAANTKLLAKQSEDSDAIAVSRA